VFLKAVKKVISLLLILAIFVSAGPTGVFAEPEDSSFLIIEEALPLQQKIAPSLRESLVEDDYVEALVKLTRQVDTEKVARAALKYAPSPQQGRTRARVAVVDRLRENASTSQASILRYLEQEKSKGSVLEYESFYIVNLVYVKASAVVIEQLSRRADVKVIMPNEKIELDLPEATTTADDITPLAVEWGISKINAPAVWDLGVNGTGVVVGIIDTGVAWQHEALIEKWRGYNPAAPGNPNAVYNWFDPVYGTSLPVDIKGHGTHVTGTVVGSTGTNQIGVAPGAQWIAANVFQEGPDGKPRAYSNNIIAAAQFMLAPTDASGQNPRPELAPDIINNSWGGGSGLNEWFRPLVQAWRSAGILPVFAAGNTGPGAGTVSSVSAYPESFAVAAINSSNTLADFSSRGPGPYPGILKPDISAPGVAIRSSVPGGYATSQGTSMAAPHICGAAALVLSANPDLSAEQLEQILKDTAVPLSDAKYPDTPNYGYGYGLVDALAAVQRSRCGTITGRVLAPGVDEITPVILHQQEVTFLYQGYTSPLEATVRDNLAVASVKAQIRPAGSAQWEDVPMYLYAGDHRNGDYWGQVPWEWVVQPGLEYKFVAEDAAGNKSESPIYEVDVQFGVAPGWSEDFSDEPLFWEWDGDWQWGVPTVGPTPQLGGKLMATNLDGNYSDDAVSFLWAPPLDLRGATAPLLRLDHWYQTEPNNDVCRVMISTDYGKSWLYAPFTGDSGGWQTVHLNLQPYLVSNQIYLCFVFQSDDSINYPGWYIDRVSLVESGMTGEYLFDQSDGREQIEIAADPIRGIEPEFPFRQPLQGPEPLNLPFDDTVELLPVAAELVIEPTGLTAANNPIDGIFSILHPGSTGEELTLHITAPGYLPAVRTFTLDELVTVDLGDIILEPDEDYGNGDVDQSGGVNVADAILVLRQIVGLVELTPSQWQSADVNLDGAVDVADAILILRFIVGLVPSLPVL